MCANLGMPVANTTFMIMKPVKSLAETRDSNATNVLGGKS
jgi:hypothetical protein